MKKLDLITIGRSSVDLYGAQIGGKLEDVRGFRKYIGGSPTNTACGTAKLGLKSAVITAVGDEHMGRFVTEELARLGVDTTGVKVDPDRLTGLVLLGIRDKEQFPLIFYRENCADMGLTPEDIDPGFIRRARALVASGTHLSHPQVAASTIKALEIARDDGMQTALDIDYRPNLWGVAGHGDGESRFVESAEVTAKLQTTLHLFDLIVGTEEEFHIAGGSTDTVAALRAVRDKSDATLVCKLGAKGAVAFTGDIPDNVENGPVVPGFPIEVFNVLGAGDGFMAGLLKGWLDGEDWARAITYANACGALAVSRHGCTPAYPSLQELEFFLSRGVTRPDLRNDAELTKCIGPPTATAIGRTCGSLPLITGCSWKNWTAQPRTRSGGSKSCASTRRTAWPGGRMDMDFCAMTGWARPHCIGRQAVVFGLGVRLNGPDRAH
jgi:5-dehydro-2-deoxygluconokinase